MTGIFMAVACLFTHITESEAQLNATQLPWFALQVRSQRETQVASHLSGKGYEFFLPLYTCRKRWSDRIKKIESPLFPGYLFCRFDPYNRLPILKTPWLIQIVGFNHTPTPVSDEEISAVRRLVASGAQTEPWPFMTVGETVRIESGPLRGIAGILTQFKGNHKLVISITLLQRSVAVEIDSALVIPDRSAQKSGAGRLVPLTT
jgi:transcription antitermination factor NusG